MGNRFTPGCRCCDPCLLYRDDFARADSADLGVNWDKVSGTYEIVDQQLVCSAAGKVTILNQLQMFVWELRIKANDGDVIRLNLFSDPNTFFYLELEFGANARFAIHDSNNFPADPIRQECDITLPAGQFVTLRSICGMLAIDGDIAFNPAPGFWSGEVNQIEVVSQSDDVIIDYFAAEHLADETRPDCDSCPGCDWLIPDGAGDFPATVTVDIAGGFDLDVGGLRYHRSNFNGQYTLVNDEANRLCGYKISGLNILWLESLDEFGVPVPGSQEYIQQIDFAPQVGVEARSTPSYGASPAVGWYPPGDPGYACETMSLVSTSSYADGRFGTAEVSQ